MKRDAALCLATVKVGASIAGLSGVRRVDGRVALVDLDSDPDQIEGLIEGLRVFAGYAGWTFGQLEGELDRGDWIVLSALPTDPWPVAATCGHRSCAASRYPCPCWPHTRSN